MMKASSRGTWLRRGEIQRGAPPCTPHASRCDGQVGIAASDESGAIFFRRLALQMQRGVVIERDGRESASCEERSSSTVFRIGPNGRRSAPPAFATTSTVDPRRRAILLRYEPVAQLLRRSPRSLGDRPSLRPSVLHLVCSGHFEMRRRHRFQRYITVLYDLAVPEEAISLAPLLEGFRAL